MKEISKERVEKTREEILQIIKSGELTHEQKLTNLANKADSLMEELDLPEGLDELLNAPIETRCICDLSEGHAPMRPRYIAPDYAKLMKEGCKFLQLPPPTDFAEALNTLLIFYKHVPSVTNYPVYLGQLDELLEPFAGTVDEAVAKKLLKMFFIHVDRTVLDSFSHANIGPRDTKVGRWIMEVETTLENAVPNLTMKVAKTTPDEFVLRGIDCALHSAKPSFANHEMFVGELGEKYVIASCYNGLPLGGGSYTLCRLVLGNIAKRASGRSDFLQRELPRTLDIMARYMDERIKFEVEESGFFENNFLVKEGFVARNRFTAMFGLVGLAEAVNILVQKDNLACGRFGHDERANKLGVEIMEVIDNFNRHHFNPYCEVTDGHFLLHAQVGLSDDVGVTPGTRIPIGEEPQELIDQLLVLNKFHKYFPSGTGDIFPVDLTVHKNPQYVLDIVRGAFEMDLRYLSFYSSDSDVIRVTGYLVKRSEMQKLDSGLAVLQNTTALGLGASKNGHILERKVR